MARAGKSEGARKLHEKLLSQLLGPLLLSGGIFYLTFHALSGERGIYALLKEERKLEVIKADLDLVTAQRKELEHRVRLLSDDSLDIDLLDEQSRIVLNKAGQDEVEVPLSGHKLPSTPPPLKQPK